MTETAPALVAKPYETIIVSQQEQVTTITFNRPEKRNALTIQFFIELLDALQEIEGNETVRVVVLAGAGPAFCAGRDFSEAKAADAASAARYLQLNLAGRERLRRFSKPVIASVHGPASGGGCAIATECADIAIASTSARFSIREVQAGSVPWLPLSSLGRARTLGLVLTGDWLSGEEAERWGFIYKCVADDELAATVARMAEQLAAQPALSMTYAKKAVCFQLDLGGHAQTEEYTAEARRIVQQDGARQRALSDFLESK